LESQPQLLAEIRFLEYRLDVLEQWPASDWRTAVIEATLLRLGSLERGLSENDHWTWRANQPRKR
jgi:hypothetical protein